MGCLEHWPGLLRFERCRKIDYKCYMPTAGFDRLSQQVLNGQIGSLKSSEFQEFFSQGKHRLRMLILLLTFSYLTYFNPQKIKPAFFLCGPRQLILNSRRSSQNRKNWLLPVFTIQSMWIIYTLMIIFWKNFFKVQTNTLKMPCEKYENLICINKWAVALYVKENKNRPDLSV